MLNKYTTKVIIYDNPIGIMMNWEIKFHRGVREQILAMPPKVQARFIRLLELMEKHGPNLGAPHTNTSPHR